MTPAREASLEPRWRAIAAVHPAPGYNVLHTKPRVVVTNGDHEIVFHNFLFPVLRGRIKAWHLNQIARYLG